MAGTPLASIQEVVRRQREDNGGMGENIRKEKRGAARRGRRTTATIGRWKREGGDDETAAHIKGLRRKGKVSFRTLSLRRKRLTTRRGRQQRPRRQQKTSRRRVRRRSGEATIILPAANNLTTGSEWSLHLRQRAAFEARRGAAGVEASGTSWLFRGQGGKGDWVFGAW
jgi:hypothetical protein